MSNDLTTNTDDGETSAVKPRVWPLFVLSLVELLVAASLQGVAAVVILFATREEGQSIQAAAQALPARLLETPMFILMMCLSGSSIIAAAFLFGWISAKHQGGSLRDRLGLKWPALSTTTLVSLLLGSIPVLLVSVAVVFMIEIIIPGDDSLLALYENMTNGWAILFIVLIGVIPGFGEELFFRGFIQRRMLERFRPWLAIGLTSLIFGVFHVTPHGIALAFILGIWLGIIAWRTDSILPGACCHAFVNSGWNVYQVGRYHWDIPTIPPVWFSITAGVIVLGAFAWSLRMLWSPAQRPSYSAPKLP